MKKKFLSLMMAAAMVATTSVSAFAAETNVTTEGGTANVRIEGNVQDNSGNVNPGTLSVTVPTAATFTVTREGELQGTTITVNNTGTQGVDVYAHAFMDRTPDDKITVKKESDLGSADRTNVSLYIQGSSGTAHLSSTSGTKKNGIYEDKEHNTVSDGIKLATIEQQGQEELRLEGKAGKAADQSIAQPVSDNFTLVLKIKKTK